MATLLLGVCGTTLVVALVTLTIRLALRWVKWRRETLIKRLPESMRDGSELVTVPLLQVPYVVGIYVVRKSRPDKKEFKGSGTMMGGFVVIAKHEIDGVYPTMDDGSKIEYDIYCRTYDGKYHLLTDCINLYTDAVAFRAPEGYKSGKVETCTRPQHAAIYAARENSNSSMGILKPDQETAYGFVSYSGSTLAGFSGGPYTNGSRILGVHLGGGTAGNYGYSASFLMSKLKLINKLESSEWEAFERALSKARKEDIEYYRGLDSTQIYVAGRFFEFENEEFDTYIEESEFLDWFFESDPEQDEVRFKPNNPTVYLRGGKRGHHQKRGDVRVYTDYVGEGLEPPYSGEGGDDSFLATTPPPVIDGGRLQKDIDSLNTAIAQIQSTLTSQAQIINGHEEQLKKFGDLFISMQNIEERLSERFEKSMTMNMSGLEQTLTQLIKSSLDARPCQVIPGSTSTSEPRSEISTKTPVAASEPSPNITRLPKRWDGMESHFEMLKTWKSSVDSSSPEYANMRDAYLKSLGLEPWQCQRLISRLNNFTIKQRAKLARLKRQVSRLETA